VQCFSTGEISSKGEIQNDFLKMNLFLGFQTAKSQKKGKTGIITKLPYLVSISTWKYRWMIKILFFLSGSWLVYSLQPDLTKSSLGCLPPFLHLLIEDCHLDCLKQFLKHALASRARLVRVGGLGQMARVNEYRSTHRSPQRMDGQSEPAATNAPVGHSVHWMGCVFSFNVKWGSLQSISFRC